MESNNGEMESGTAHKEVPVARKKQIRVSDFVLRVLAVALSLVAAVVLGVNKQNTTMAVILDPSLPPVTILVTAKWSYLSPLVYLVIVNAIACAYATMSLLLTLANLSGKKGISMMMIISDLVIVALLFSAIGGAFAAGLIAYQGNSHVQWNKVCNTFGKFCGQVVAAGVVSFLDSVVFFLLVVLAVVNLQRKR